MESRGLFEPSPSAEKQNAMDRQLFELQAGYTPLVQIPAIIKNARVAFDSGVTRTVAWRRKQLTQLMKMVNENRPAISEALRKDLAQTAFLANLAELEGCVKEAQMAFDNLDRWMKPESKSIPPLQWPGKGYIVSEPLGVVLIIAPCTLILPLIGAIAAGNAVVSKPSECVCGGAAEGNALVNEKFDKIFFTGGGRIGRMVLKAAADTLTPVALELGGKCPVLVDKTANIDVAAKRIAWGKFANAGQTCVAPDYVLVEKQVEAALLARLKAAIEQFYGRDANAVRGSADFSRIVNEQHAERLRALLAPHSAADFVVGGQVDVRNRFVAPTVVSNVKVDSPLMREEIFGPILPVLPVDSINDAVRFVNARDKPLSLYIFSKDQATVNKVLERSTFVDPSIRYPPYTPSKIAQFEKAAQLKLPTLPSLKQIGAVAAGVGLFVLRSKL